ncbi:MAG: hypothetical protein WEC33_05430, partial [Dehalococcoidia bacterium]
MAEQDGIYYDRKDQLDKITALIIEGERLLSVLDCKGGGTGYVGITTRRLIFQDANWRKTRNVLVSVPLDRVHAVGISDQYRFIGSNLGVLSIQAGDDDWTFEFKSTDKVKSAYQAIMTLIL